MGPDPDWGKGGRPMKHLLTALTLALCLSLAPATLASAPKPKPTPTRPAGCCKACHKGKACGNTCIKKSNTCTQPKGCACNGK